MPCIHQRDTRQLGLAGPIVLFASFEMLLTYVTWMPMLAFGRVIYRNIGHVGFLDDYSCGCITMYSGRSSPVFAWNVLFIHLRRVLSWLTPILKMGTVHSSTQMNLCQALWHYTHEDGSPEELSCFHMGRRYQIWWIPCFFRGIACM